MSLHRYVQKRSGHTPGRVHLVTPSDGFTLCGRWAKRTNFKRVAADRKAMPTNCLRCLTALRSRR